MLFLHISKAAGNSPLLDKYVAEGKCIFVLIYMNGCGPCEATRPEWAKLKHTLSGKYKDNNNVIIADVNNDALKGIQHIQNIRGFPTMRMIYKKGQLKEDFEEGKHLNKARTVDAFIEWIELNMKQQQLHMQSPLKPFTQKRMMHHKQHKFPFNKRKKTNKSKSMHRLKREKTRRHHTRKRVQ